MLANLGSVKEMSVVTQLAPCRADNCSVMSSPHDALFRHTFGQPEHAAGLFKSRLPAVIVEAIDWSTLALEPGSFVDDNPELAPQ